MPNGSAVQRRAPPRCHGGVIAALRGRRGGPLYDSAPGACPLQALVRPALSTRASELQMTELQVAELRRKWGILVRASAFGRSAFGATKSLTGSLAKKERLEH